MASSSEGIVCALVARGPTILAEHSTVSGNSSLVALSILEKQAAGLQGDQRVSYLADRHAFHLLVKQGLTYLCVADQSMGKRLPYLLLDDLCVRVEKDGTLFAEAASAPAYSLTKRLGPVLSERVAFFNHDPSADALSRVQGQVQELKSVMVDNIDRILDRGDRLELLVHRTDDLQVGSIAFKRDAHRAKRAFQWQHLRLKLAVGGGVLLLAYVVVCVVCSPTFQC